MVKILRIIGIIGSIFLIGAIVVYYFLGGYMIKNQIDDFLKDKTQGLYVFDCSTIRYNFFTTSIQINDFDIHYDSLKADSISKVQPGANFYQLKMKQFIANEFSILDIIENNRLKIDAVVIDKPTFKSLYPVVRKQKLMNDFFHEIDIKSIVVNDAKVIIFENFLTNQTIANAKRIDLLVDDLYFKKGTSNQKEIKKVNEIAVRFLDYSRQLVDKKHILSIDTLSYSLQDKNIHCADFVIKPIKSVKDSTYFYIKIPQLKTVLTNDSLFNGKGINISSISIDSASFQYYKGKNKVKGVKDPFNDLQKLCKSISVDQLNFTNAQAQIYENTQSKPFLLHELENISIQAKGFVLDEHTIQQTNKIGYCNSIKVAIKNYASTVADKSHTIRCNEILLDTDRKTIGMQKFSIQPKLSGISHLIQLQPTDIQLSGINFLEFIYNKNLIIKKVQLGKTSFSEQKNTKNVDKLTSHQLIKILNSYINSLSIQQIDLQSLTYSYQDKEQKGLYVRSKLAGLVTNFSVDLKNPPSNFLLNTSDYFFNLQDFYLKNQAFSLQFTSAKYAKSQQKIGVKEVKFLSDKQNNTHIDLHVPQVVVNDFNFDTFITSGIFKASKLSIQQPDFVSNFRNKTYLNKKNNVKKAINQFIQVIPEVAINQIEILGGKTFMLAQKKGKNIRAKNQFNLYLDGFLLNKQEVEKGNDTQMFAQHMYFAAQDQYFDFSDGVHQLFIKKISVDANNELLLENAHLYPIKSVKKASELYNWFDIKVPKIRLKRFNIDKWLDDQILDVSLASIDNAIIQVQNQGKKRKKEIDFKNINLPLPKGIKIISVADLILNDCKIKYSVKENGVDKLRSSSEMYSNIENYYSIASGNTSINTIKNAITTLKNIQIPLQNNQEISIDELYFHHLNKAIIVSDFKYNNPSKYKITIPKIYLTDLDYDLLKTNYFIANQLLIDQPKIDFFTNDIQVDKDQELLKVIPRIATIDLYSILEPYLYEFTLKTLRINNASIYTTSFEQDNISLLFEDILINDTPNPNAILYSKNILFELKDFESTHKDQRFKLGRLKFDFLHKDLLIDTIKIYPTYNKSDYIYHNTYRKDRIESEISSLHASQIDWKMLLDTDVLKIKQLDLGESLIDFYKDYSVQVNTAKKPNFTQLLLNVKQKYSIDSITMAPSQLYYFDKTDNSSSGIYFNLNEISMQASHLTNIPELYNPNTNKIKVSGKFKNEASIETYIQIQDSSKLVVKGTVKDLDLPQINSIIEDVAHIGIEKGTLKYLTFDMLINEDYATGLAGLKYNNLQVNMLNKKTFEKRKILSRLANWYLANNSNKKKEALKNSIEAERDPSRSFIMFWIRSVMSGVQSSFK